MEQGRSFKDIKEKYNSTWEIPYSVLLELKEWKELRERILNRDQNTCTMCHKKGSIKYKHAYYRQLTPEESRASQRLEVHDLTGDGFTIMQRTAEIVSEPTDDLVILHVHHTYYVHGDAPWEYPDESLMTLCDKCHVDIHRSLTIPTYSDESKQVLIPLDPCIKCHGVGFIPEYGHVQNGICFECKGRKFQQFVRK